LWSFKTISKWRKYFSSIFHRVNVLYFLVQILKITLKL
jgi:hypothetical protein